MTRITTPFFPPFFAQYLGACIFVPLLSTNRATIAGACFALYITSSLLVRSFASPWLGVGWTALAIGFLLAPRSLSPKRLYGALIILLLSHALAIPGSLLWGSGNWETTSGILLWMAPALLLYVAGTRQTFHWLTPVFLVHAFLVIYQGFTNWRFIPGCGDAASSSFAIAQGCHGVSGLFVSTGYATGLTSNPNLAAGFLALGLVYFMADRRWSLQLLVVPTTIAILFTGSRWGILVSGTMLLLLVVTGHGSLKSLMLLILGLCAAFVLVALFSHNGYSVAGYNSFAAVSGVVSNDITARLALPHIPSFLPRGVAAHPGLHNVPLRIAVEKGIQAAILWGGITAWALWRRPRSPEWWMLFSLVLLSMLDYYTWMGHLGGFWWLLVGLLAKQPTK